MSISQWYAKEIRENTTYLPTWLPNVRVAPGDVGRIKNFQFTPLGNLGHLGVSFESEAGWVSSDVEYYSAGSVSVTLKLAGQAPLLGSVLTQAETGVRVAFARENAIAFRCAGCRSSRITNQIALADQVLALHDRGTWPDDLVVVTEVVSATSATVLISSAENASIDLRVEGTVGSARINLAAVDAGFRTVSTSNMGVQIVAESELTPLIRTSGIQKRLLRPRVFRSGQSGTNDRARFEDVEYADYAPARGG